MDIVSEAVNMLGVHDAIEEKINLLYTRLTEEEESGGAVMSALLPTVSVFINYASTRDNLKDALQWLRQKWGIETRDEAMWTLATLVLKQIIKTGLAKQAGEPEKVAAWTRMRKELADSIEALAASQPQPALQESRPTVNP